MSYYDYVAANKQRDRKKARDEAFQEVIAGVESAVRFDLYTNVEIVELVREVVKALQTERPI